MLSVLLSKLDATTTTSTNTDDTASSPATNSGSAGALTGPTKPSLSSMILGLLIGQQQQSSDGTSSDDTSSSASDPVSNLFSAMDTDGDGTVSQSELENYIEQQGGTATAADNLFSMLDTSGSDGITEDDLASQAPPPPPHGGPGGPHHHHGGDSSTSSADQIGSQLVSMFDTNGDGSVSQTELEDYVTSNGGTTAQADSIFSALDTGSSGSLSSSDFSTAIENLQQSFNSNPASQVLTMLDVLGKSASDTTGTVSVSA